MRLAAGTRLGPYEIVGPIGAGGMGEVYKARDPRIGRDVAIKVLPAAFAADADRLRRFEQEARATGALNHPNLLALYDVGTSDSGPYLVSELLDGQSLRERLSAGPVPLQDALDWVTQIAHGLSAAHGRGVVHRDLKPENVFLLRDRRVKLLDFGLAKLDAPIGAVGNVTATAQLATSAGITLGTVGYMAPEQVRGDPIGPAADIFALGALLYELVAGRPAFRHRTSVETLNAILKEESAAVVVRSASGRARHLAMPRERPRESFPLRLGCGIRTRRADTTSHATGDTRLAICLLASSHGDSGRSIAAGCRDLVVRSARARGSRVSAEAGVALGIADDPVSLE